MTIKEVQDLILAKMPDARVKVSDMTGTADHFEISVVSKSFEGKTLLEQHKIVFAILEEEMKDRIHAVKLKTKAA